MFSYKDEDGFVILINGPGCKNCPVKDCQTGHYRGSVCAAQRSKFNLGDPQTKAEKVAQDIQMMSDDELKDYLEKVLNELIGKESNCNN